MPARIYSYWRSSAAHRVRIGLELKGIDYEIVPVSLVAGGGEQHSPTYRAINPQGLVPFFNDGEVAIGQSLAILEYLEDRYPEVPLLPASSQRRAAVRSFCQMIACDLHPLNNLRVRRYLADTLDTGAEEVAAWCARWIDEGLRVAEGVAAACARGGPFVFGESATLADVCLVPQLRNAQGFNVKLGAYPRLLAVLQHCETLPAFMAAEPVNQPDCPAP